VAYGDTQGKGEKVRKLLSALVFPAWITIMALAGFYTPSLILKLPFFQVSKIIVEGNVTLKEEEIIKTVMRMEPNLMKLKSDDLLFALNEKSNGRVRKVFLSKDFGLGGVALRVRVEERIPVARINTNKGVLLIDKDGYTFPPTGKEGRKLPLVITGNMDSLITGFSKLYEAVLKSNLPVKKIYVKNDRITVKLPGKVVTLPSLQLLPANISERFKMIYNLPQEIVDLRYDRFILVRN